MVNLLDDFKNAYLLKEVESIYAESLLGGSLESVGCSLKKKIEKVSTFDFKLTKKEL